MDQQYVQYDWPHVPPAFTRPGATARFLAALASGVSVAGACRLIGAHPQAWYNWSARAEAGHPGYEHFTRRVLETEGQLECDWVDSMNQARAVPGLAGDTRAVIEMLGRRFPNDWAQAQRIRSEVTVTDASDTDDVLRRLLPESFADGAGGEDGGANAEAEGDPQVPVVLLGPPEPAGPAGGVGRLAHPKWPWVRQDKERGGVGPGTGGLPSIWEGDTGS